MAVEIERRLRAQAIKKIKTPGEFKSIDEHRRAYVRKALVKLGYRTGKKVKAAKEKKFPKIKTK